MAGPLPFAPLALGLVKLAPMAATAVRAANQALPVFTALAGNVTGVINAYSQAKTARQVEHFAGKNADQGADMHAFHAQLRTEALMALSDAGLAAGTPHADEPGHYETRAQP